MGSHFYIFVLLFIIVISLKKILLETRESSHCWLSPTGKIIPVDNTHDFTARRILSFDPKFKQHHDALMLLWKKGYIRVTYMYDGSLIANNEVLPPNDIQKRILIKLAQDGNHEKVVYDRGDKDFILWTINDTL